MILIICVHVTYNYYIIDSITQSTLQHHPFSMNNDLSWQYTDGLHCYKVSNETQFHIINI